MLSKCEVEVVSVNGLILVDIHPVHLLCNLVVGQTQVPHHQETQQRQQQQEAPLEGSQGHLTRKSDRERWGHSQKFRSTGLRFWKIYQRPTQYATTQKHFQMLPDHLLMEKELENKVPKQNQKS